MTAFLKWLLAWYNKYVMASTDNTAEIPTPPVIPSSPIPPGTPPTPPQKVYNAAVASLGKHLTLDETVPDEEGCADSVSTVLGKAGYKVPIKGLPGVLLLISWMQANHFHEIHSPVPGCVITSHSKNGPVVAHTGIVLKHGIASNDSRPAHLGLFLENYSSVEAWSHYFVTVHNCDMRFWLPV